MCVGSPGDGSQGLVWKPALAVTLQLWAEQADAGREAAAASPNPDLAPVPVALPPSE